MLNKKKKANKKQQQTEAMQHITKTYGITQNMLSNSKPKRKNIFQKKEDSEKIKNAQRLINSFFDNKG